MKRIQHCRMLARNGLMTFSAIGLCVAAGAAHAQELPETVETPDPGSEEDIVVTGSLQSDQGASPVDVVSRDELEGTPRSTVAEFLFDSTIAAGSLVLNEQFESSLSSAATVNLRGLGARSTLVLLNGRRQVNHSQFGDGGETSVDLNALLPTIMIQRVEILKDGGTSLYGADAVAGVVNFISRDNFEGFEVSSDYQRSNSGGQDDITVGAIWGVRGDRGRIVASIDYQHRDPLAFSDVFPGQANDRQLANMSTFGFPGSFGLIAGQTYIEPYNSRPRNGGGSYVIDQYCGDPAIADATYGDIGVPVTFPAQAPSAALGAGVCLSNQTLERTIVSGEDRLRAMAVMEYEFTDSITGHVELNFSRSRSERMGRSTTLNAASAGGIRPIVPTNNPGNFFGGPVRMQFNRIIPGATPASLPINSDLWRVVAGLDGEINDRWKWNTYATYAKNDGVVVRADTLLSNLNLALNGFGGYQCDPTTGVAGQGLCEFYNPFGSSLVANPGDPTYNSPEILDFVVTNAIQTSSSSLLVAEGVVSGELFELAGKSVGLAFGVQHRRESLASRFDEILASGELQFVGAGSPQIDFDLKRNSLAGFFELIVPVVDLAEVQISGRYEDLSTGQSSFDPKVGITIKPHSSLTLRASYGTAFRAPGLFQLASTEVQPENILIGGVNQSVSAITKGNPDLLPEQATTLSVGFDFKPLDGLKLNVNYWSFDFTDIVLGEDVQVIASLSPNDPRLIRDSSGTIIGALLTFSNAAALRTSGVDFGLDWAHGLGRFGRIGASVKATWVREYDIQSDANSPVIDGVGSRNQTNLGVAMPEWRYNASLTWSLGGTSVSATVRRIGGVEEDANPSPLSETAKGMTTMDLGFFQDFGSGLTLRAGVVNVFNTPPPAAPGEFQTTDVTVFPVRGRVFSLGFTKQF